MDAQIFNALKVWSVLTSLHLMWEPCVVLVHLDSLEMVKSVQVNYSIQLFYAVQ